MGPQQEDATTMRMRRCGRGRSRRASSVSPSLLLLLLLLVTILVFPSSCVCGGASDDVDSDDRGARRRAPLGTREETPGERRAKLERAFGGTMFPGGGSGGGGGSKDGGGAGPHAAHHFYSPPPGRLGAVGGTSRREKAFEAWVREPVPTFDDDGAKDAFGPAPRVGPVEVRSVWGRGRGVVTTRNVTRGETLMELPLMKCLSTASARASAIGEDVIIEWGGEWRRLMTRTRMTKINPSLFTYDEPPLVSSSVRLPQHHSSDPNPTTCSMYISLIIERARIKERLVVSQVSGGV